MLLTTGDGARLSLTITGYQFPEEPTDRDDANWLRVKIDASDGRRAWTSTNSCLLTSEALALAHWFEGLSAGHPQDPPRFVEPNLRFEAPASDQSEATVRVSFELESRPPWAESRVVGEHALWIDFPLSPEELLTAAASIRQQIESYPPRP